jgi:outer membrane protein, heavy metal efflux system
MKSKFYIILLLMAPVTGFGQNLESFLKNVNENHPRLVALQKWLEAEKIRAQTGIYPDNPKVSYDYLFGNAEAIGDQQEFEIMQSFKLPGYYSSKAGLLQLNYEQKAVLVQQERHAIMHIARTGYYNLVWLHKMHQLLETRKNESVKLVDLMNQGFEGGEVSKPEFDKARIYNMSVQAEWQKVVSGIAIQEEQLRQMSGEAFFENVADEYPLMADLLPLDSLVAHLPLQNPDLMIAQLEIEHSDLRIRHEKLNQFPSLEAGYRSEKILNQKLQGMHAGIEIPLWQNKNQVKQARIQSEWSRANFRQMENKLWSELTSIYLEIQKLQSMYAQMKSIIQDETISESSLQLLKSGQISFPEYLMESQFIWEVKREFLEIERNYYISVSELKQLLNQM